MREIYKVAYDEVEEMVLVEETRAAARGRSATARAARDTDWDDVRRRLVAALAARGPARLVRLLARRRARPRR